MSPITSNTELRKTLLLVSEMVIENASSAILDKLQDDIMTYTYTLEYFPNKMYHSSLPKGSSYHPTFEFMLAWVFSSMKRTVTGRVKELYYDSSQMNFDPNTWLHGSTFGGDARANLADILNVSGYTSELMAGSRHFSKLRQPYWDLFITSMVVKGEVNTLFRNELSRMGISFI